jgi:aspartate/methionine/tyrosine aminotransferase
LPSGLAGYICVGNRMGESPMARFRSNDIMSLMGGAPRFDLAESLGPDLRLGELLDGSMKADLADVALAYGTAAGDGRLRECIAASHAVGADDVVVTMGGMHALFLTAFILCGPGDEAVAVSPLFPPARNVLEAVGAKVRTLRLSFDRGYRLDAADLRPLLSERTRLVSLASPQNPSGVALAPQTIRDVVAVMNERCPQAHLLVDETYREAVHGDDPVAASAVGLGPKIISCASLSKCHGAPGLRLGWAITRDAELREQLVLGKFNTVICCSPVDEALALTVLAQRDRIIGDRRRHLAEGLRKAADWARRNAGLVDWVRPNAGALCCVRLNPSVFDDAAVGRFHEALAREGVRVASGVWFGDEPRIFRLGFGFLSLPELEAALEALSVAIRRTAPVAA